MLGRTFALGGTLLVAAALVFLTPGPSHAAARGGFHGGGFHASGYHFGGYRGGYHYGGYHYHPYYGGYHYGGYHYRPYYGGYYPYYNYYPYDYSYYPYYSSYPYYYSDLSSGSVYDPGYSSGLPLSSEQLSSASTPPAQADTSVHVTVNVPAGARLWFDGAPTTSTGPVRQFDSPPLTPGRRYTYDLKASWNENGQEVTQTQKVDVTAGAHVNVNFPVPPKTAGQASADTHN
jgi:uncharacterized protein (TIGR03000 family)